MAKQAEKYITTDGWSIVEDGFHKERNAVSESLFSLGNEYCGIRGYMEEGASAPSLQGCYFNGVYEWAEKTNETAYRGIIKRGHYMVNAVNPIKTEIYIDKVKLDIGVCKIQNFKRKLDFKSGLYMRSFTVITEKGKVNFVFSRFLSMTDCRSLYQRIEIDVDYAADIEIFAGLDFAVKHWGKDGRWTKVKSSAEGLNCSALGKTQSTNQYLACFQNIELSHPAKTETVESGYSVGAKISAKLKEKFTLTKHVSSFVDKTGKVGEKLLKNCKPSAISYGDALKDNENYYKKFWEASDIEIVGDEENQQGIRFCIFQLQQTYHGIEPTDNIGAKGLTGEAYSGHAFWDTETYCLPYFLFNNQAAAKDLLLFRYNTLDKAKERAKELDCEGACYPIATLNGNEACDLWQHASLQFQPSTGVAYGIMHYVNVTGDTKFLTDYGMEMLLEISRFLRSRGEYGADGRFGYFCVMGPDEFQMMVNHNCYTNYMAKKTFEYTVQCFEKYGDKVNLGATKEELKAFSDCAEKMYIPYDKKTKLFEQHDGFFRLPHVEVKDIPITDFPLYHHWSYDRIYRNDMIKQPDVLMFMLLYGGDFTFEQKKANYEYYEPRCIHESSLSPSVHSILASELKKHGEALKFFGFASRLDLDDYNRNTCEGLHTTSIAAAWLNIVYGFGGVRSDGEKLIINPSIPDIWQGYSFKLNYRNCNITVKVQKGKATITVSGGSVNAIVCGKETSLSGVTEFAI
ncbi:MAG: family 65 glycosyl hydrolase [Clostridia bacterium]|nr:family 65 glycosyl hydrolase [Clostridia bacterium]